MRYFELVEWLHRREGVARDRKVFRKVRRARIADKQLFIGRV